MSADRELLELAAKAAGIVIRWDESWGCFMRDARPVSPGYSEWLCWGPLTDDGDALRLAVKLKLCIAQFDTSVMVGFPRGCNDSSNIEEDHNGASSAATRRAIVRAAAEIGKAMP